MQLLCALCLAPSRDERLCDFCGSPEKFTLPGLSLLLLQQHLLQGTQSQRLLDGLLTAILAHTTR